MYQPLKLFSVLLIALVINACGGSGGGNSSNTGKLEIITPSILTNPSITGLRIGVSIDGGTEQKFDLTGLDRASLDSINAGTRSIAIRYYVILLLESTLSTTTETVIITKGGTTLLTPDATLLSSNFDDDDDGYTNLAEIRIGTNPNDFYDSPGNNIDRDVSQSTPANASSTNFNVSAQVGDNVSGMASSTNYKLFHGLHKK